jgi:glycine/D-amino acid oxidase-like deaminating enzyme
MQTDYIIIGQGLCGTFLSYYLHKAGKKIIVVDESQPFSSTKVASGVINPVTGRQIVTTWMIDELLPFAWDAYREIGNVLGVELISEKNVISFPSSQQMRDFYDRRIDEKNVYLSNIEAADVKYNPYFTFLFGAVEIHPVYLINLHYMLKGWRKQLAAENLLLEEAFHEDQLKVFPDHIEYKGINAEKIIYCNGVNAYQSSYWENLPATYNKGEAVIVDIPDLPQTNIYKFGSTTIVPWYDGLWWVGSTYENNYTDAGPTEIFKRRKDEELKFLLKQPYTIIDHIASIRPAAMERRPFVGLHPVQQNVGIFDGMGTKGCSLAPFLAKQFSDHLTQQQPLLPEADVKRFQKILSGRFSKAD